MKDQAIWGTVIQIVEDTKNGNNSLIRKIIINKVNKHNSNIYKNRNVYRRNIEQCKSKFVK